MRMNRRPEWRHDRERGAVVVIVAISMTVLIGAAAFTVDTGGAWESQRRLRTSTDAAALAAAATEAEGGNGCTEAAGAYLSANDPEAEMTSCQFQDNGTWGYVSVSATRRVDFQFAGIFGIDSTDVNSTTHAMYGQPTGAKGVRPMGLCIDAHDELSAWLNLPDGPTADSDPIRIEYTKDHPNACGDDAPGNWGMLSLDGGQPSNAQLKEWVRNGYGETVTLSPPNLPGDPGAFDPSIDDELSALDGLEFAIPLFDEVSLQGSNAEFRVVGFVWVKLIDYRTTGAQADRFLELQFLADGVLEGTCCGSDGPDTGVGAVRICGTDPDSSGGCVPEDGG